MTRTNDILAAARGLAVTLVLGACMAGCDRAPAPEAAAPAAPSVEKPADDAAYQAQLQGVLAERKKKTEALVRVNARLRALEERARAALPAGATPEQVRAELEGHPRKYPAYRELLNAQARCQEEMKDFSKAQQLIRANKTRTKPPAR